MKSKNISRLTRWPYAPSTL